MLIRGYSFPTLGMSSREASRTQAATKAQKAGIKMNSAHQFAGKGMPIFCSKKTTPSRIRIAPPIQP